MIAIGLMSGTSLDGIDVALIDSDGERIQLFGPTGYRPYSDYERALLRRALADAASLDDRNSRPGVLADVENLVTRAHIEAARSFLNENGLSRDLVDVVGFHGQTVLHRPEKRLTVQIGNGQALASELGIPVVYDMRIADVTAGGQGAPLVPVYHRALVQELSQTGPTVVANIGGVANITYIDGDELMACDTGPGNALLDDFMLRETGVAIDRDGGMAAFGHANEAWIAKALKHPFFGKPLPKSLDRNDFATFRLTDVSLLDGAATLTALTAATIARVVPLLPKSPQQWIFVGGGANNPTLMRMLNEKLSPAKLTRGDNLGWSGDAIEAQAFAYMAIRSLKCLPLTYPGTTGVRKPLTGGLLANP